jgi:hypothetical protein
LTRWSAEFAAAGANTVPAQRAIERLVGVEVLRTANRASVVNPLRGVSVPEVSNRSRCTPPNAR